MSRRPRCVPIPLGQHFRMLRMTVLPLAVVGASAAAAFLLWRDAVAPAMMMAEVSARQATINSPEIALVRNLAVSHLQRVTAGELIAELGPADPRRELDLMQNEINLLRAAQSCDDALITSRREALDFERLRLDWLSEKVALAAAAARAAQAGMDLESARNLNPESAAGGSNRFLKQAQLALQAAEDEVNERRILVETLGSRIEALRAGMLASPPASASDDLMAAIGRQEQRLRTLEAECGLVTLKAPLDGVITAVFRRTGEHVLQGEPLVVITALAPERILGYLHQPFALELEVGQEVEVRTQGRGRQRGMAVITRVGGHLETIANPALHPFPKPEVGLPVETSLPERMALTPGEIVSLWIRPKPRAIRPTSGLP